MGEGTRMTATQATSHDHIVFADCCQYTTVELRFSFRKQQPEVEASDRTQQ